ncbi:Reverse transcriptase zinc-binding domain [Sesbania bispinosa]|nr:Reverse transcriptase zinc-binding domain [Sesbania bispinosa]
MELIQGCLQKFCRASGERVNVDKTRLFVSKNVHGSHAQHLSQLSGFALAAFTSFSFFANGQWNVALFNHLLLDPIVREILNHPVPDGELGEGHPSWRFSPDGSFTTKSAYMLLTDTLSSPTNQVWDSVWRWEGPQRVRCFLWGLLRVGLKTNLRRVSCSMGTNSSCPLCNSHAETETHIPRDCRLVHEVWRGLPDVLYNMPARYWNGDWKVWISNYLCPLAKGVNHLIFGVALWTIWMARNDKVF